MSATSSLATGYVEKRGRRRRRHGPGEQGVEVELGDRGARRVRRTLGRPGGAARRRGRRRVPPSDELGAPAGVPRREAAPADGQLEPEGARRRPGRSRSTSLQRRRPALAPPAGRGRGRRHTAKARCSGWSGSALLRSSHSPSVGRRSTGRIGAPTPECGQRDRRGLEQRQVARAAARRCGRRVREQARQQRRGHERLFAAQRVGQPQRRTTGVGGLEAETVEVGLADEREVEHLDVALARERATDATAHRLVLGEPAARRRRRQHARDVLVADDARDLLDEVEGVGEVGPPGRHRRGQRVGAGIDLAADGLEVGDRGVRGDVHAGDPRGQVDRDA